MRKLILQEFVSIDGFAADSKGTTEFFENITGLEGREIDQDLLKFISSIDLILLGATTYKLFAEYWPKVTTEKEPVADALNQTPKIVFSERLKEAPWGKWKNARVVGHDLIEEVKKLKQAEGKNIVLWGSISIAQLLLKEKLIDEVQLRLCPIVLGKGRALFSEENSSLKLKLINKKIYDSGVVFLSYQLLK